MRDRAITLQNEFHEIMGGDFKNPQANALHGHMKHLVDDIDARKPITGLDHRIESIQNQLRQSKFAPEPFMDVKHFDYLHKNYEDMRLGIHKIEQ